MKTKIVFIALAILFLFSCKKDNPGPNEVFMDGTKFNPSSLTISSGTTITWTNKESSTHTVTSDKGTFESGDMMKSKTFSFTFTTAGTFAYHCKHHSGMTGSVTVQ